MPITSTIWPQSAGQPIKSHYQLQNRSREKEESKDEGQLKDQPALEHGEELGRMHRQQQKRERQPGGKG